MSLRDVILDEIRQATTQAEGTQLTVENIDSGMAALNRQAEEFMNLNHIYTPLLRVPQQNMVTTSTVTTTSTNTGSPASTRTKIASDVPGTELNRLLLILSELEKTPYTERARASFQNLKEEQRWIIQQIQKGNARSLLGLNYKVVFTQSGLKTTKDWDGKLESILGGGEDAPLEFMVFRLKLKDKTIYDAKIFQLIPVKKVQLEKLDKKDLAALKKAQEEKVAFAVLDVLNRNTNAEYTTLKNSRDRMKRDLDSYIKLVEDNTKKLAATDKIISGKKIKTISLKDLNAMIASIKKHAKVEDAYISKQGGLIVLTKTLVGIDPESGKELKAPVIGRMIFKTDTYSGTSYAYNIDYTDGGHGHPNLSGIGICKGTTESDLSRYAKSGDYYALVDLLILFFSLYPQDGGSPYVDFDIWLQRRGKTNFKDAYFRDYISQMLQEPLFEPSKQYLALQEELKSEQKTVEASKTIAETEETEEDDEPEGTDDDYEEEEDED